MATETTTIKVVADTSQAERALASLGSVISGLAVLGLAQQFVKLSDASANLQNKLSLVTVEGQKAGDIFKFVAASSNRLGASLNDVGNLFFQVSNNSKDLGLSQETNLKITENLIKGFQLTGQSMAEVQGSITQLGQAFSIGTLRGDELNSVMEGLPIVAQTLAKNLGVTTGALKAMGEQGRISSQDLANAILESGKALDSAYMNKIPTISAAFKVFSNSIQVMVNDTNNAEGITAKLSKAILILTEFIIDVNDWFKEWGGTIMEVIKILGTLAAFTVAGKIFGAIVTAVKGVIAAFGAMGTAVTSLGTTFSILTTNVSKFFQGLIPLAKMPEVIGRRLGFLGTALGMIGTGLASVGGAALAYTGLDKFFKKIEDTPAGEIIDDINKKLGVDQVKASEKALKANGGLTTEQVKLGNAFTKANADRDATFASILRDQEASLKLTEFEGIELEYQQKVNEANSKLIKEVKNDKGVIVGYTAGIGDGEREILRLNFEQTVQKRLQRESTLALNAATQNLNTVMGVGRNLTNDQLDIELQILEERRKSGGLLTKETEDRMRQTAELNKQLAYQRQIKNSLDAVNRPLGGAAAGASAAGQLGSLDPMTAAMSANKTMFDGLKYLRDQDLISEQQYQNARVSATVQAQQAIFDATKKQYENEALLRIQAQTGQQFGLETQKQMAGQAAQFEMKTTQEKYAFALDSAAQMYSSLGTYNKKAFEAAKAFNIANAIMNTYAAATKALATYPFPFGLIAAAGAVAAGMAQVNAIRSQQFSGRALGGPVMNGQSYIVGERGPEVFTPNTNGSITRNSDLPSGGTTNINFTIVANDAQGFDDLLLQRRGMITQMISDAQLESGRRV